MPEFIILLIAFYCIYTVVTVLKRPFDKEAYKNVRQYDKYRLEKQIRAREARFRAQLHEPKPSKPNPVDLTPFRRIQKETDDFILMKKQYMRKAVWKVKRQELFQRDSYTCQGCGIKGVKLEAHHTHGYAQIPNEPISCLVSLCRDCHEYQHTHYGFPTTIVDYENWNAPLVKRIR